MHFAQGSEQAQCETGNNFTPNRKKAQKTRF
jgi:hypothetical protein